MKHRSVIAFVIVAAALFAAPQLSHDLRSLRGAVGARVHAGLMQALLSMPVSESAPEAVAAPSAPEALVASCTKEGAAAAPAGRQRRAEQPAHRAEARAESEAAEQLASMIEPPPVSGPPAAALPAAAPAAAGGLRRVVVDEVAMIIPPDSGIDPQTQARALAGVSGAHAGAEEVRMTYVAGVPAVRGPEWQKRGETLRGLEETLRGAFEFRVVNDGSKVKVLKVKRCASPAACPLPAPPARAPRAPRAAGQDEAGQPLPAAVGAVSAFVGE